jgi:hypothetical protein
MKRLLFAAALSLAFCAAAHARQTQTEAGPGTARKLDEFGGVAFSDMLARVDNFAIELQNDPAATGLIAVYPQMSDKIPGWFLGRAYWMKGYLIKGRGLGDGRVRVVNAGFRDEVKYELWVVPPGAESPAAPLDWAAALAREKKPILFDRTVYENYPTGPGGETGGEMYEDYTDPKDRHEPFVSALRADPAARGLIVGYATRRNRRGTDRALASRRKLAILKLHPIGADRIVAAGGGLRTHRTLEYWIVPPGAALPKPTPAPRLISPRAARRSWKPRRR